MKFDFLGAKCPTYMVFKESAPRIAPGFDLASITESCELGLLTGVILRPDSCLWTKEFVQLISNPTEYILSILNFKCMIYCFYLKNNFSKMLVIIKVLQKLENFPKFTEEY